MCSRRLLAFLFVVSTTAVLAAQAPLSTPPQDVFDFETAALPPVGAIIGRMVERARAQDEANAELAYEARILTRIDTLNGEGEVTKTEHRIHRRYPVAGQLFEELIEQNGQPLNDDERREQLEKREEFARDVQERAAEGRGRVETNDERQIRLDEDLMSRYEAAVVGVRPIDDEPHYVVEFKPRAGKLPEKTRMDRALNRSSGTLYIARKDYGLKRIEFATDESVGYFLGLARLRSARGSLEFQRVAPDVWLPKRYDFGIDLRIFFFRNRRQQIEREWIERRLLPPPAAGA